MWHKNTRADKLACNCRQNFPEIIKDGKNLERCFCFLIMFCTYILHLSVFHTEQSGENQFRFESQSKTSYKKKIMRHSITIALFLFRSCTRTFYKAASVCDPFPVSISSFVICKRLTVEAIVLICWCLQLLRSYNV